VSVTLHLVDGVGTDDWTAPDDGWLLVMRIERNIEWAGTTAYHFAFERVSGPAFTSVIVATWSSPYPVTSGPGTDVYETPTDPPPPGWIDLSTVLGVWRPPYEAWPPSGGSTSGNYPIAAGTKIKLGANFAFAGYDGSVEFCFTTDEPNGSPEHPCGASSPPPVELNPIVPGAILEIYVNDPDGDKWDVALWDTATWAAAGWESITPWSISADVTFGATRAEAGILHKQDPASWSVETWDPDRVLDASNPDSPFSGQLVAGLPIRLSVAGRIIRTGQCDRIWYSHAGKGGRITATDAISRLANARVPEDTILTDSGPRTRAQEAIAGAGVDVETGFAMIDGDPTLSPAPSGDFTAWQVIERAASEILSVVYVDRDDRLRWRSWTKPLQRGASIGSPEMIDLATWTSWESLYSVVRVLDHDTSTVVERRASPLPAFGERVYERTENTIHGDEWANAVLADRRDQSLRYVPGDIRPMDAESVDALARLDIMEDVTILYPEADPSVEVRARILGMRVTAVDETREDSGIVRTRWRWRLITTLVAGAPLIADQSTTGEYLHADQDPTQLLYPDGVTAL
jgi:hypothetical protein